MALTPPKSMAMLLFLWRLSAVLTALATKEQLNVEYLSYLTTSSVGRDYFDFTAKKTTNLASTNATTILEFKIPFPSREEQDQIVAFLNTECSAIDELMARNDDTIGEDG